MKTIPTTFLLVFCQILVHAQQKSWKSADATQPVNQCPIEMVYIAGGTFNMGSENGYIDEKPVHLVTLGSYSISKYEVTQQQWKDIMGCNPSAHKNCPNCPVENVRWDEVQLYLRKLNAKYKGHNYRLPTEAEWEYAAKGGSHHEEREYAGGSNIDDVGWYSSNTGNATHTVGRKTPNKLGLYDMSGNVWEWCADGYGPYGRGAQTNPTGLANGAYRVYRGGGWSSRAANCRSARRNYAAPTDSYSVIGFRIVGTP